MTEPQCVIEQDMICFEYVTVDNVAEQAGEWIYLVYHSLAHAPGPPMARVEDRRINFSGGGDWLTNLCRDAKGQLKPARDFHAQYLYSGEMFVRVQFAGYHIRWGAAVPSVDACRSVAPGTWLYSRAFRGLFLMGHVEETNVVLWEWIIREGLDQGVPLVQPLVKRLETNIACRDFIIMELEPLIDDYVLK